MRKKRIIKIAAIVIFLALLTTGILIFTKGDPVLIISAPTSISPETEFSVDISIKHNPGIAVFVIDLKYDETVFEFVSVENGNLFTNELAVRDRDFDDYHAVRVMFTDLDAFQGNGVLYSVNLRVKPDAELGDYNLDLSYSQGNIVKTPGQQVNPDIKNATVKVY